LPKVDFKKVIGTVFHSSTVIIDRGIGGKNRSYICLCKDCGNVYFSDIPSLKSKTQRGCSRCGGKVRRKVGDTVNGFKVVGLSEQSEKNKTYYFECPSCAQIVKSSLSNIKKRKSTHCGCLRIFTGTHNKSNSHEYKCWLNMKSRILYKKGESYEHYVVKRGLDMDPNWRTFENFYRDMGDSPSLKHSIERVDNLRGYWPDNCVWATSREQSRNTSRNVWCLYQGTRYCLKDLCQKLGIRYNTVITKRRRGNKNPFKDYGIEGVIFL
jgi:hypothetical protein